MIQSLRAAFNQAFTEEKYQEFLEILTRKFNYEIEFRVAETPVFIPIELRKRIFEACDQIVDVISRPDFIERTKRAIPEGKNVPGEDKHTQFLAIDFAICEDKDGNLIPQLIEMQGFPSLFAFQDLISQAYRSHFNIPANLEYLFSGLTSESYRSCRADRER
ncbi:MAG TPA: hypothetical protein PKY12_07070 [Catalimonadaceae bacterium]|nr:hypothetical protein [Catalimonadaceae bacterium]